MKNVIEEVLEKVSGKAVASKIEEQAQELEAAGMVGAAKKLREKADLQRRLAIAYEHYRFVRPEKIEAYRTRLRKQTEKRTMYSVEYMDLGFTPLEKYEKVPPGDVLKSCTEARKMGCFDSYEVAHILAKKEVPDPIVFGRIKGCEDRFFISQWDSDVSIEDILMPNEG